MSVAFTADLLSASQNGERYDLFSPKAMPKAAGFLWNKKMMLQITCRGYAVAQHMQPEPSKYAHAPLVEGKTFMLPEQPYYVNHPGRFFYIKDEASGKVISIPYEPMRSEFEKFTFSVGKHDLRWEIEALGLRFSLTCSLPVDSAVELWELNVENNGEQSRNLSIYSYFPIGYMSWMNHGASYRPELKSVVATSVTAYQKLDDYFKNQHLKDLTFFACEREPIAWETRQEAFEGEGGLHNPSAINDEYLSGGDALYELPIASVQYREDLKAGERQTYRFLFGPAFDVAEIKALSEQFLSEEGFARAAADYSAYITQGKGCLQIETPDETLNHFVNHWLPRQVFYHGDVNRLTTDPQTRNYLQDNMGMTYIHPETARRAFIFALSQQEQSGAMPDGILLVPGAELKYINQIPHTDHCVWLPVCLKTYLDETDDYAILDEYVVNQHTGVRRTVRACINAAMRWLIHSRDERGLSFIAQGDWCDPMNMVGYKGKGVSGWLTVATAYALNLWAEINCDDEGVHEFSQAAKDINAAANRHLWDGNWYARGITDDDVVFGIEKDNEGRIFLNPQSWAIMANTPDADQRQKMIAAVEQQLETPYGPTMLAPAYTAMRDDVGRVTQKHPGAAENGSVYNHAAVFYIFSLFLCGESERANKLLRQMIPGPDVADYLQRGQLPIYIPNYYRGAYYQFPRTAGRSSQLFNTGTVSWFYRCVIEGLFGLKGCKEGLMIDPQLPQSWQRVSATRYFRGATFNVDYIREVRGDVEIRCEDTLLEGNLVREIQAGKSYSIVVKLPT
ncbi:MAG: GH36-type glycosyl hydrolase domain-containing protein [Cellvibrio sp.]